VKVKTASDKHARKYGGFTLFQRLLSAATPYWPHLTGIFLLSLLSVPLALLTPVPLKLAVDSVIGSQPLPKFLGGLVSQNTADSYINVLALAIGLLLSIALLQQLQRLASSLLDAYTSEQLVLAFRSQLFRHVQRLSLSYHDTKGSTDSTYRIQYDAPSIRWVLIDSLIPLMTATLTLAGMIYITFKMDWQLALVASGVSPLLYILFRIQGPRLRRQWTTLYNLQSFAMAIVQEVLVALRVVKAFGKEDMEHDRFVRHSQQSLQARIRLAFAEGVFRLFVGLIIAVGTALIFFIGVRHVRTGVLTVGELLIVVTYLSQLYERLEALSQTAANLQGSLASAERAFSLLDEVQDVTEKADAVHVIRSTGNVSFRNVSFSYGQGRPIIQHVSFQISPGTRVGIVGATGAGKTTLVNLLTRFYDPTAGQILLDGVDLRDYKLTDLRNQFAIVLQEPVLFSTSIAENIAYGRPGASKEKIVQAAKQANAHEFILRLRDGYDSQVGQLGMTLSGGERQRIALARAFLKDAQIVILDEPTSSVDVNTEANILSAMERLMLGRTTFMIAHRLGTLKSCDVLLVIENGRLVALETEVDRAIKEMTSGVVEALADDKGLHRTEISRRRLAL
jgi:ATP-binding cassette, subfamily B, bacterial